MKLLLAAGADVDGRDEVKNTPVSYAAGRGRLAVIEALVAAGVFTFGRNRRSRCSGIRTLPRT